MQTPPAQDDDKTPLVSSPTQEDNTVEIPKKDYIDKPFGFQRCRSVEEYEFLNQIGSGTYGIVCKYTRF
jgi:hypothetical protein